MVRIFLYLALALPMVFANAGEVESLIGCIAESEIGKKVEFCDFNEVYVKAAVKCDNALKNAVSKLQEQILKEFKLHSNDSQTIDVTQQKELYDDAKIKVAKLILKAETSRKELDEYLKYLVYPEDSDVDEQNQGSVQKYAMSISCYGSNRKELERIIASFDSKIDQLKTTRLALQSKELAVADILAGLDRVNKVLLPAPGKAIPAKPPKESRGFRKSGGGITESPGSK